MRHALARSLIAASVVAALLLTGCGSLSRSQSRAPLAARGPDRGDGIYVASFLVATVQPAAGLTAAIGFDLNTLPHGIGKIGVINRWNGAGGKHSEETRLLNAAGQVVAADHSELTGEQQVSFIDPELSQTAADVLDVSQLIPGPYTVVVLLDGREYARYTIRIVALPTQGARAPAGQ